MDYAELITEGVGDRASTESGIAQIESLTGLRLPEDYASYLRRGGWSAFGGDASVVAANGEELPVFILYAAAGESNSVLVSLARHPDLAPEQIVPIGRDRFGNLFVLDGKRSFSVYMIDYTQPVRAIEVAPSFAEFMARIQVTPYDD